MPSSDNEPRLGTIFMGPTPDRETTLDKLYSVAQRDIWNKRTEDEYMERVKVRATEQVRALLLQARKRGDEILTQAESRAGALRAEAEQIRAEAATVHQEVLQELEKTRAVTDSAEVLRENARQEGLLAGHEEAMAQLMLDRQALGETTAVVLISIQEQCARIFDAWRDDLSTLLREAVTKGTGWVIDNARAEVLDTLLDQSVRALLDKRHFTVRVNPADAALVTDMLADAHKAGSRTLSWELGTDTTLEPGSLVVESDAALVDNSRKARQSVVDEVLKHLSLPTGQVDQAAFDSVANTLVSEMRQHGIDLQDSAEIPDTTEIPEPLPQPLAPDFAQADAGAPTAEFSAPDEPQLFLQGDNNTATPEFDLMNDMPHASDLQPEDFVTPPEPHGSQPDFIPEAEFDPTAIFDSPATQSQEPAMPSPEAVEADTLVAEFLEEPASSLGTDHDLTPDNALPSDVADDLLAEMGFGPGSNA